MKQNDDPAVTRLILILGFVGIRVGGDGIVLRFVVIVIVVVA